jgi:hypothetical protein
MSKFSSNSQLFLSLPRWGWGGRSGGFYSTMVQTPIPPYLNEMRHAQTSHAAQICPLSSVQCPKTKNIRGRPGLALVPSGPQRWPDNNGTQNGPCGFVIVEPDSPATRRDTCSRPPAILLLPKTRRADGMRKAGYS